MTQEERDYLLWRCKTNWHHKYHKYINEWIDNVLPQQLDYFKIEMKHLIKQGLYDARR